MSKKYIIAVDGFGASGKSTLAQRISSKLNNCPLIGIDYFCYPPTKKEGEWWGQDVKGYGYDWERLRDQVIIPASEGKDTLTYQELDWDDFTNKWGPPITDYTFLIIEGVSTLRTELQSYYDLKIWVEAPLESQLERVKARDGDYMLPFWEKEFKPLAHTYFQQHRPDQAADIIYKMGENADEIFAFIHKSKPEPQSAAVG